MKWNGNFINVGDRVTYKFEGETYTKIIMTDSDRVIEGANITSVERPVNGYTTVYAEWKDEEVKKPKLLTDEEEKYLNRILDFINLDIKIQTIRFKKCFNNYSHDHVIIEFVSESFVELEITCHDYRFDGVEEYNDYSISELGL